MDVGKAQFQNNFWVLDNLYTLQYSACAQC
jgi:hypothetical protein